MLVIIKNLEHLQGAGLCGNSDFNKPAGLSPRYPPLRRLNSLKNTDSFVKWKNVKYVSVLSRRRPEKVTLLGTAVSLLELNFSACYNVKKSCDKVFGGKEGYCG